MADYLVQEGGASTDRLLLESGGLFVLEDGTGDILLETSTAAGGGRFQLEDGTGFILLETGAGPVEVVTGGGIIIPRRRLIQRLRQEGFEEDEAVALAILLTARKKHIDL